MAQHTMYTFKLHRWGVVLLALGALLVCVLLAVGGCLVGEWRAGRAAAEAGAAGPDGTAGGAEAAVADGAPSDGAAPPAPAAAGAIDPNAPVSYTLRLGTFGSEEEAKALADQATARGYSATVQPAETSDGTPFFTVAVGSYGSRWEARGAAQELAERESRRGWRPVVVPLPAPP